MPVGPKTEAMQRDRVLNRVYRPPRRVSVREALAGAATAGEFWERIERADSA